MKYKIFLLLCLFLVSFGSNAYSTPPSPIPEREENLVEKYKLYNVDKIAIKIKFSDNFFRTIHKGFEFSNSITDSHDIKTLLAGISQCGANEHWWHWGRDGELVFYSKGKIIFSFEIGFFYGYDPILIVGDTSYFYFQNNFYETFLKYLPSEFKKAKENMPRY